VIRAAHGFMYVVSIIAGAYGFIKPDSAVSQLYGGAANTLIVALVTVGGALGVYAYALRLSWLEMVGIPVLAVPVALICPALFYDDYAAHRAAWTGWLCAVLVFALISRWLDVRALRAYVSGYRQR
jgi:hypothetical protein